MRALIGSSGFIGGFLASRGEFSALYRRSNIDQMRGGRFTEIICAGMPAQKWLANREPEADLANLKALTDVLETVSADRFILISTIDVFSAEQTGIEGGPRSAEHAYGRHRAMLEDFVATHFREHHVVRLPAMFGPGLRKNAVFDLLHDNQLEKISPRSMFQWYDLRWLEGDLAEIVRDGVREANLFTPPVSMGAIQGMFFPDRVLGKDAPCITYSHVTSRSSTGFVRTTAEVMSALGAFVAEAAT